VIPIPFYGRESDPAGGNLSEEAFIMWSSLRASPWIILALALVLSASGCSSSGGGSDPQPPAADNLATTVPFTPGAPLALLAGVPSTNSIYIDLPADFDPGQLVAAAVNLSESLSRLSITRTDGGASPDPTVEFQLLVAAGDERGGACGGGTQALRTRISGTGNGNTDFSSTAVSVDESTMPQGALDLINAGTFTLCASALSTVDANVTLSGLALAFGFDGACEPPEGLAGVWTGDYSCDDCQGGPSTEAGTVELRITQSGDTAVYQDDSGATYVGSVCASGFRHLGLGAGYFEYGTFTRTGPTTAVKSSTWVSTIGPWGGCCADTLTLSPN
jgi:hypothetical protein